MKRRLFFVESYAKVDKTIVQDMTDEYDIDERASRIIQLIEGEVSDRLLDVLRLELQGFCPEMQVEMAEDLLDFALGHVVHTTGCRSVDFILDYCYTQIAFEHEILICLDQCN